MTRYAAPDGRSPYTDDPFWVVGGIDPEPQPRVNLRADGHLSVTGVPVTSLTPDAALALAGALTDAARYAVAHPEDTPAKEDTP